MILCPFCGDAIEKKNSCPRESCLEARARIATAETDSRGFPVIRKTWQLESSRLRKAHNVRMLPAAYERIRSAARRERMTVADMLERWALSLPEKEV